jgi:hypothetical protein
MLSQINLWAERAGMFLDLLLMLRILTLRLRQTYVFITLFVLLSLFYDGVALLMGSESPEFRNVTLLSKFVYSIVYPLVAWDLFEEAKQTVDKVRKMAMSRMMTSLLFITLWGLLIAAFTGGEDSGQSMYLMRVSIVVWTGAIASALAFLWVMRKGTKVNNWELPRNTSIWYTYFGLILMIQAIWCVLSLGLGLVINQSPHLAETIDQGSDLVLNFFGILLTAWCTYKLRAVPSDASNVTVDVKG